MRTTFFAGTSFEDIVALSEFDQRLRTATFAALTPIELGLRALLGHELGRIDPCAHLKPELLGPTAQRGAHYATRARRYQEELSRSREEFVEHHGRKYAGRLPVWAAVELLDWGSLERLYEFSPRAVQNSIALSCSLTSPQLARWLRSLRLVRNICAHQGRLFHRVHPFVPKLPRAGIHQDLDALSLDWTRTFGQLTLVRFLSARPGLSQSRLFPAVLGTFPQVNAVPMSHSGAPVR